MTSEKFISGFHCLPLQDGDHAGAKDVNDIVATSDASEGILDHVRRDLFPIDCTLCTKK